MWNLVSFYSIDIMQKTSELALAINSTPHILNLFWRVRFTATMQWIFSALAISDFGGAPQLDRAHHSLGVRCRVGRSRAGQRGCAEGFHVVRITKETARLSEHALNRRLIWSLVLKPWGLHYGAENEMRNKKKKNAWKWHQASTKRATVITFHETEGTFIFAALQVILVL